MKPTTMTIAALLVATVASGAAAPAFAQDQGAPNRLPRELHLHGPHGSGFFMHREHFGERMRLPMRGRGAGILALVCSERGADRLEHMLLNIKQRTDPTGDQAPLYDDFAEAALAAQADFAASCADARAAREASADLDLVDRLQRRLDRQRAHLDAMSKVLPAFEAFYDSLSDEQKRALEPRRRAEKHMHRQTVDTSDRQT